MTSGTAEMDYLSLLKKSTDIMEEEKQNAEQCWESIYREGKQFNKYPFDFVVSFIHRHYPREKDLSDVKVLEVGCGFGNNLFFVSDLGMSAFGVDGSDYAISKAKELALEKGLEVYLKVGSLDALPYEDETFDLIIDRSAIGQNPASAQRQIISECRRVLKRGGKFLYTPYSDSHSSARDGFLDDDRIISDISESGLVDVGPVGFMGWLDLRSMFPKSDWKISSAVRREELDFARLQSELFAIWIVICEKA
jgi:SAM-dependent methyltransferase